MTRNNRTSNTETPVYRWGTLRTDRIVVTTHACDSFVNAHGTFSMKWRYMPLHGISCHLITLYVLLWPSVGLA